MRTINSVPPGHMCTAGAEPPPLVLHRVNSSNYPCVPFYNAGCHMVALNLQTDDLPVLQTRALFALNGNCGYYLKHPYVMAKHLPPKEETIVTIRIISGHRLCRYEDQMDIPGRPVCPRASDLCSFPDATEA